MEQKTIARMTGYKATDADMKCRDFEFEIGKWYEVEGELEMCANGFHFCQQPSGPWAYYTQKGTRVWKIEAEEVLDLPFAPGADYKYVARRIRFVVEVIATGYSNTGDSNTGYSNTGNSNTGNSNTGNSNTGYSNTGDRNTGDRNTGYSNTGDSNTGDSNTGDSNTGYSNTGDSNTGDRNTGDRNTGYSNTGDGNTGNSNTGDSNTGDSNTGYSNTGDGNAGDGNATNYSSGFFCQKTQTVKCFDVQTKLTRDEFCDEHPQYYQLSELLGEDEPIDFEKFKNLPGITRAKLKSLHKKHIEGRKQQNHA